MNIEKILKRANLSWPADELEVLKKDFQEVLDKINNLEDFSLIDLQERFADLDEDVENKIATKDILKYLNVKNDKFVI